MARILVIEDDEPISELIKINLSMAGYEVLQAFDGEAGLRCAKDNEVDLVLLDIMIPKIDGYNLLPSLVKMNIPVMFLTAKDSLKDRVKGLNMGADDYITKPFEGIELIARVKTVLRRTGKEDKIKGFDDILIHYDKRRVTKGGQEVCLTPKEFELLRVLVENKGAVLSREKLLSIVWEYDFEGNTRTVDMHVQRLRNKLDTDRIITVYKMGYRLEV
jgi:two-component system, OmpR family, alkaline phosphatase synthesis response regulator PhoP